MALTTQSKVVREAADRAWAMLIARSNRKVLDNTARIAVDLVQDTGCEREVAKRAVWLAAQRWARETITAEVGASYGGAEARAFVACIGTKSAEQIEYRYAAAVAVKPTGVPVWPGSREPLPWDTFQRWLTAMGFVRLALLALAAAE